jgi:hypothetical protein
MAAAEDKKAFFLAAAQAMQEQQADLDQRPAGLTAYAIPRATVEWRFSLEITSKGEILFWGHDGPSSRQYQRLGYEVLAIPFAAPKPGSFSLLLRLPPFVLPWGQELHIAQEVFGEGEDLVCLPLAGGQTYFVIHLAEDLEDDRQCIHQPGSKVIPFDRVDGRWNYQPFRTLFDSLRQQQASGNFYSSPYRPPEEIGWGWDHLDNFVARLWDGYAQAMAQIAKGPLFYDIPAFEARFLYSPRKAAKTETGEEVRWIDNEVQLSYDRALGRMTATLVDPEFLLRGEARDRLLDVLLSSGIDDLIEACAELSEQPKLDPQAFRSRPADALFVLSFENEPDDTGFVAVWPTPQGDYLFNFNSDGLKITDGPDVFLFCPSDPTEQVFLKDRQYRPIRNFFKAYRFWRHRKLSA